MGKKKLRRKLREQKAANDLLQVQLDEATWELNELLADDPVAPVREIIFEAEGRQMEGREFGSWLRARVKRFVSYG